MCRIAHRAEIRVRVGSTHAQFFGARNDLCHKLIVDGIDHDQPRARRALLAGIAERALDHAQCGSIEVGGLVHQDRVLATEFEEHTLDPLLAIAQLGRRLVDRNAGLQAAGEVDKAGLRMIDKVRADLAARARQVVDDARRKARFLEDLEHLGERNNGVFGRLADDGIANNDGTHQHAGHQRHGEVPRRDGDADAQRDVEALVLLAGIGIQVADAVDKAKRLAGIVLGEIDHLGDFRTGFDVILADLVH